MIPKDREKIREKQNYICLKSIWKIRIVKRVTRKTVEWEKIFTNHISYQKLIPRMQKIIYSNSYHTVAKQNNPIKIVKEQKQTFFKRRYTSGLSIHEKTFYITDHREM